MKTVLVERYATLGGVCLNVGCIPSKALLHVAAVVDEAKSMAEHGIAFGEPKVDLAKLVAWKDKVVGKLTGGPRRHGQGAQGRGRPRRRPLPRSRITSKSSSPKATARPKTGAKKVVKFAKAIIAAGSQPVQLAVRSAGPAHPRFDVGARSRARTEAHARRRRRHHRPRDGHRVLDARRAARRRRDDGRTDAGRRPRPRARLGEDEQAALRPHHAEDEDRGRRSAQGRRLRRRSKAQPRRRDRNPTTSC